MYATHSKYICILNNKKYVMWKVLKVKHIKNKSGEKHFLFCLMGEEINALLQ